MAIETQKQEKQALPNQAETTGDGIAATDVCLRPTGAGEGVRVGFIGDSGSGKTFAMVRFVERYLATTRGCAFIVDDKEREARFAGQQRLNVADLARRPPDPEPRAVVFRGSMFDGVEASPEDTCRYAWQVARHGVPVLVVADEIERAAANGQWRRGVDWVPRTFGQGRAAGVSIFWGAQSPQMAPTECFEQSSVLCLFKIDSIGARLLIQRGYITEEQAAQLAAFPGQEAEKSKRGNFLLAVRGQGVTGPFRFAKS